MKHTIENPLEVKKGYAMADGSLSKMNKNLSGQYVSLEYAQELANTAKIWNDQLNEAAEMIREERDKNNILKHKNAELLKLADSMAEALEVCSKSLLTYGEHPLIEKQVNHVLEQFKSKQK